MGRARKSGKREANGRLSRKPKDRKVRDEAEVTAADWETMGTALMARARVHEVAPANLKDQMAGSVIGRYCLKGLVTRPQYDAALKYLAEREEYLRSIGSPREPGAVDLNAAKGKSLSRDNVARDTYIRHEFQTSRKAMGGLWGAVDAVVVWGVEHDELLGDLCVALGALVRRYERPKRQTSTTLDVATERA